jgi:serine/threonine protein kinase
MRTHHPRSESKYPRQPIFDAGCGTYGGVDERTVMTGTSSGPDTVAGRYRLSDELGRGGMGVVWLAHDELLGRQVAVKEMRIPFGLSAADREVLTKRALAEARNAARINHPHAVALYDVVPAGAADAAVYLIMELVQAPTLAQMVAREGPLAGPRAAGIGLQLLDVLDAAHGLGVVHRDVKPANVLVAAGDQAKLTDFGIAHGLDDTRLTRSGIIGTQAYPAPELFESGPINPAADLWSLGATLYYATAGRGPFDRQSTAAVLSAILVEDPPTPQCEPPLATAIAALLTRDPGRRATSPQVRSLLVAAATSAGQAQPTPAPDAAARVQAATTITPDKPTPGDPAAAGWRSAAETVSATFAATPGAGSPRTQSEPVKPVWEQHATRHSPTPPAPSPHRSVPLMSVADATGLVTKAWQAARSMDLDKPARRFTLLVSAVAYMSYIDPARGEQMARKSKPPVPALIRRDCPPPSA